MGRKIVMSSTLMDESAYRKKALVDNLWVINATIICSALLTLSFGEGNIQEIVSGFVLYLFFNVIALILTYRGYGRLALIGYTSQVFICNGIAMVLMNETPTHMVLAMVNFVLLHAVGFGNRNALWVTAIMVVVLGLVGPVGDFLSADILDFATAKGLQLELGTKIKTISLTTTTLSTGYLITTTVELQNRTRLELVAANYKLEITQKDLMARHERARLLSDLGAEASASASLKSLIGAVMDTLEAGLPDQKLILSDLRSNGGESIPFILSDSTKWLNIDDSLESDGVRFAQTVARLYEGAYARVIADERLRESQRLEGVGRLAASVAHDFNNLLVPISAALDILDNSKRLPLDLKDCLRPVWGATRQASALVKKLLTHASSIDVVVQCVDFGQIVHRNEGLLRTFIREDTQFNINIVDEPLYVLSDPIELEQLVLNLVLNARDSIDPDGEISVSLVGEVDSVKLVVCDDGPGIPEDRRKWVFQPFHTTRPEGTGLGLATVERITKSAGGQITIGEGINGGALVTVRLPRIYTPITSKFESIKILRPIKGVSILLVEDEHEVREAIKGLLNVLGHRCCTAINGQEAIEILSKSSDIELIISDYQMPVLTGLEFLRSIRETGDCRPLILMTGYGASVSSSEGVSPEVTLSKPIRMAELQGAIVLSLPQAFEVKSVEPGWSH